MYIYIYIIIKYFFEKRVFNYLNDCLNDIEIITK